MQKKKLGESEALYGELGQAFNFTHGDLEANRAGFLSFRQKREQKKRGYSFAAMIALPSILLIAIIAFILFVSSSQQNPNSVWTSPVPLPLVVCFFLPIVLLILVWVVGMMVYYKRSQYDLQKSRIEKISGQIRQITGSDTQLRVGSEELNSPIAFADYSWGDLSYMVYYLPHEKQIVSIEEIVS